MSTLLIVLPSVFFLQYDRFKGLIDEYVMPWVSSIIDKLVDNKWIVFAVVFAIIVGFFSLDKIMQEKEKEEGKGKGK